MSATTQTTSYLKQRDTQPAGAHIGVSFNWGLALSLTIGALSNLIGRPIGPPLDVPTAIGSLVGALVLVVLGEALRRGNGVARRIQIGLHSLLILVGIPLISLPTLQLIQQGRLDMLTTFTLSTLFLYVVSPIEIWLLLQQGSRQWYGIVASQEARLRHSGSWLIRTLIWAVVCGILQAIAPY